MRLLMVAPMPPQARAPGAIPLVLHAQLRALLPRHEVTLVFPVGPDTGEHAAAEGLRAAGLEVHAAPLMVPTPAQRWRRRWRLASMWLRGRSPWRTAWFFDPGVQRTLDRLLAEGRFDLVQVEDSAMGVYRYRTEAPVVFTEHEVRRPRQFRWRACAEGGWRAALGELDWQRWSGYQRAVWGRFDRVQVFTGRDAQAVAALAPELADRVRVNPFAVALPPPADPRREEPASLLFVGNFTHRPNVDAALWLGREVMPELRARRPGVRLTVVGICPPPELLGLACADTEVTGPVPEIEPLLERAAVVLAPIRIGGGMRMKVLQSMAMGKAVVTTPRGAEGLTVEGRSPPLRVAPDAAGIAGAVIDLLDNAPERRALGQEARDFVAAHFSPEAYARRLEAVYGELVLQRAF